MFSTATDGHVVTKQTSTMTTVIANTTFMKDEWLVELHKELKSKQKKLRRLENELVPKQRELDLLVKNLDSKRTARNRKPKSTKRQDQISALQVSHTKLVDEVSTAQGDRRLPSKPAWIGGNSSSIGADANHRRRPSLKVHWN